MGLTFLVPLFLLGLLGVAVPIIVHLTHRQRRRVVAFPSLMFLERIPFQERRRRRIQHWMLLGLRALALSLIALAFARPFLDDAPAAAGGGGGPRELVVLLDQSYSMNVADQWERAVEAVRAAMSDLGPLDRASLVVFAGGARVLARSTADPARLTGALDTVRVGSRNTRFGPALKVAETILEESTLPAREVVLVSDFQRGGWSGDEGVSLPAGTVVTQVPVARELSENRQVADVSLARRAVSGRERVTVTARIVRRGGRSPVEVPVSLEVDGRELQTRPVTLPGDGAVSVTFEPFTVSQPHTRGTVRIPGDSLPDDDQRHFVLSPGSALSVLMVNGGTADGVLYLRRALEVSPQGRFRITATRRTSLAESDLSDQDVVVLVDARVDGPTADNLRAFVERGGGVLVVLGERGSWPRSAGGVLPGTPGSAEDRREGRGGRLGQLDYDHPVFERFAGPRSGDFTGARFFRARRFAVADSVRVLARFDDGSPALAERRVGRGSVMVWASTLDAFWNDLALQPVYLPFVHGLVEYLSGRGEALPWLVAGQVVDVADPEALEGAGLASPAAAGLEAPGERVVLSPTGRSVTLPGGPGPRYVSLEEQGFYTVRPPGSHPPRPFTIAVNVDLAESNLARIDPEELKAQLLPEAAPQGQTTMFEADALRREDRERRQALWRWILLGAFALLVGETVASNWVSRRAAWTPRSVAG